MNVFMAAVVAGASLFFLSSPVPAAAASFSHNLSLNGVQTSTNVVALQEFLKAQGVYSGEVTGYFGPMTYAAVVRFQTREGIFPPSGYWGPVTRERANTLAAGGTSSGTVAGASTISDSMRSALEAQLRSLMAQIESLRAKLASATTKEKASVSSSRSSASGSSGSSSGSSSSGGSSGSSSSSSGGGSSTPAPEPEPTPAEGTPMSTQPVVRKSAFTTLFWAGEGADASNGYISNVPSYWDEKWGEHFGGVDDPEDRCGYRPCSFVPKENPFYVALPYGEYGSSGLKASAKNVPWYSAGSSAPLLKNRWVEVAYRDSVCYGQWQDVGPFEEDDFAYVFGNAAPKNTYGVKAGLDVSPALYDCLGMTTNATTEWRFVDAADVPDGPWKETVTTSGIYWR